MYFFALAVIVAGGITLVVCAVYFTASPERKSISDADEAIRYFQMDYPELDIKNVYFANENQTAFLDIDESCVGIVQLMGQKFLTRLIAKNDIKNLKSEASNIISVSLNDFTWKGGTFLFSDVSDAKHIMDRFEKIMHRG